MWGNHLGAIIPISFITIVLFGIVGGGTYHTTLATILTDGKTQFGSGSQRLKQKYFYAIGSKNIGRSFCKKAAVVAAVVRYGYFNFAIKTFF